MAATPSMPRLRLPAVDRWSSRRGTLHRSGVFAWVLAAVGSLSAAVLLPSANARGDVVREQVDPILRLDLPGHTSEIRALAFLPDGRLLSAGRDKLAMIWPAGGGRAEPGARDVVRAAPRERVVRWQVARGTRGVIQAVAVASTPRPLVALAGSGAMGSTGEILLVDPGDGTLVATLGGNDRPGHRGAVVGLDFSADGRWLFSSDVDGQAFAWDGGNAWQPVELRAREERRLGPDRAAQLAMAPATRPIAAVLGPRAALAEIVSPAAAAVPVWRVALVDPARPAAESVHLPFAHAGGVLALDATPDGRFLAAADAGGKVAVWDLAAAAPEPKLLTIDPAAESLALAPDGGRLVVGVATRPGGVARLQVWDVATGRPVVDRERPAPVRAVATSADGTRLASAGGWNHEILLEPLGGPPADAAADPPVPARRLGGFGRRIGRVAFARQAAANAPEKIALGLTRPGEPDPPELALAFDLRNLTPLAVGAAADWAAPGGRPGTWTIARAPQEPPGGETWNLSQGGRPAGTITLERGWQGRLGPPAASVAWLQREGAAEPWAVVLGTDRGLFVYELAAAGACRIVRRYRGHEDGVLAVAVSEDGRWLASGGRDGIVMLWPAAGIDPAQPLEERWGVGLRLENGRAVVAAIAGAGPLAGRDVRVGDVIARITAADGAAAAPLEAITGPAVVAALSECPWPRQLGIVVEREGKAAEPFNRQPAWENIASLYLAANREWAYWSPRGYYAASANGDTLFGWLVNRGVDKLPRFFRAQQFRRRLERPDVMARLLAAGSLGEALRTAARDVPRAPDLVLPEQIVATPEVTILAPRSDAGLAGPAVEVTATIDVPAGATLTKVRAYASGVVARGEPQLVAQTEATAAQPARKTFRWRLDLPDEDEQLVQVFAGTAAGPTDVSEVTVTVPPPAAVAPAAADPPAAPAPRRPRLVVVAAGIDRYDAIAKPSDLDLSNLAFATTDARTLGDLLPAAAAARYDRAGATVLCDAQVTRSAWRAAVAGAIDRLTADVRADDLLVIVLAGHGVIDDAAGRTYRFLCADARLEAVPEGLAVAAEGSIAWEDFAAFENLPCRKLALIDTCHAGGLQPNVRAATVREFQENRVLVLAAASDAETSKEAAAWGHGAFTRCLLDSLRGAADTRASRRRSAGSAAAATAPGGDGIVTLDEIAEYVVQEVPRLVAAAGATEQHPSVSPAGLVRFMTLPLATPGTAAPPASAPEGGTPNRSP